MLSTQADLEHPRSGTFNQMNLDHGFEVVSKHLKLDVKDFK